METTRKNVTRIIESEVRKIAVLKAGALGDFIVCLPALESLRHTFRNAKISLLGKSWLNDFCHNRSLPFHEVIEVPYYKGVNDDGPEDQQKLDYFFKAMQKKNLI